MTQFLDVENLRNLYNLNPNSTVFAYFAAQLMDQGNNQKAAEICLSGLKENSNHAFGHFILGVANFRLESFSAAKKDFETSLAIDKSNPQAWYYLSKTNEKLNLPDEEKECYLRYFLSDPFNEKAAARFLELGQEKPIEPVEELTAKKDESSPTSETEEFEKKQFEDMMDEVSKPVAEESDYEKSLEEVFQKTISEMEEQDKSEEMSDLSEKVDDSIEQKQPKDDSEKSETVETDEFSEAMESFFSDYEKEESDHETKPEDTPVPTEEDFSPEVPGEDKSPEKDQSQQQTVDKEKSEIEELEYPQEFVDEEPLDFSEVVKDLISEREGEPAGEGGNLIQLSEDDKGEQDLETEIPKDLTTGDKPDISGEDIIDVTPPEDKSVSPKTEQTSIVSPTLGEIYIAQGRFQEAIEVFQKLIDKDPSNARFKRKIDDLQKIIDKQESSKRKGD